MSFWEERNAQWERDRQERDNNLRARGFRIISCVAYFHPATGAHPMTSWSGETETLVITNISADNLKYGIGCIFIGPDSEVLANPENASEVARERNGVVLTVFKGRRPW